MGWTIRSSSPDGARFLCRPDRLQSQSNLPYNRHRILAGSEAAAAWCWPSASWSCRVASRSEIYRHIPSVHAQACYGATFTFTYSTKWDECLAFRKAPYSHQAKQPVSFYKGHQHVCDSPNSDDNCEKYFTNIMAMYIILYRVFHDFRA